MSEIAPTSVAEEESLRDKFEALYQAGRYSELRGALEELGKREAENDLLREYSSKMGPDPFVIRLLFLTGTLLLVVTSYWFSHRH